LLNRRDAVEVWHVARIEKRGGDLILYNIDTLKVSYITTSLKLLTVQSYKQVHQKQNTRKTKTKHTQHGRDPETAAHEELVTSWTCRVFWKSCAPLRGWALREKGKKQKLFLVLSPRPGPDGPNASGWYRRLCEPISPLSLLNCDQL